MSDDRTEVAAILLYHTCAAWAGGGPTLSFEELPEEEQEQFRKRAESIANIYGLESRTEAV